MLRASISYHEFVGNLAYIFKFQSSGLCFEVVFLSSDNNTERTRR